MCSLNLKKGTTSMTLTKRGSKQTDNNSASKRETDYSIFPVTRPHFYESLIYTLDTLHTAC